MRAAAAKRARQRWEPRELDFLHQHYASKGADWCAAKLGRSASAVKVAAHVHGLTQRGAWRAWRMGELAFLREHYAAHGVAWCAQRLGRSAACVKWQAERQGIKGRQPRYWTAQEVQQLRRCWLHGGDVAALAARLGRGLPATYEKARLLGLPRKRRWEGAA